jgi:glycosyltransferase involved in cell wall biosynthesis
MEHRDFQPFRVLIYNIDKMGLRTYSEYLVEAMKKLSFNVVLSDKIDYNFDIIHIQFEHGLFRPFGLGIIPLLIKLKLARKKIVITSHTVLSRKEIYTGSKLAKFFKKILFPLNERLIGFLCDKMIAHTEYAKQVMMNDYKISSKKIEVIPHGVC